MKALAAFLFFCCITFSISLYAIRYPVEPTVPQVEESRKTKKGSTSKKVEWVNHRVRVKLGSKDSLTGHIQAHKSISFKHYKNGLRFSKTVTPNEIKSIRILNYSQRKVRKTKEGTLYEFYPAEIEMTLTNNRKYHLNKLFRFLNSFRIDTIDGTTTLYTFFADTYHDKKGWLEVASKDIKYHRLHPHPQAVTEIVFELENATGAPE